MNIRKAFLLKAVPAACALFAAGTIFAADRADLMGYVPGAEVMKVDVTDGRIDTILGIIYSQIKSQRSIRQLRMTVMTPRTKAREPAMVYFRIPHRARQVPGARRGRQGRRALPARACR